MTSKELTEDCLKILSLIHEKGGTDCTGTCHHRKPGEFHCHVLGQMVHLSSQGVKNRILKLLRLGLLKRETIKREDGTTLIRFMITRQAKETLKERKAI